MYYELVGYSSYIRQRLMATAVSGRPVPMGQLSHTHAVGTVSGSVPCSSAAACAAAGFAHIMHQRG